MGSCLGCLKKRDDGDEVTIELAGSTTTNIAVTCKCGSGGPNIKTTLNPENNRLKVEGQGVLLGSCALDCDTGYWEVIIGNKPSGVCVGVKRFNSKKPTPLTGSLLENTAGKGDTTADSYIFKPEGIEFKTGDVVGIYWDQTDLPMLNFTLNGEEIASASFLRVRPACDILPAVSVESGSSCEMIFDGNHFVHPPKSSKFKMIVCATSII